MRRVEGKDFGGCWEMKRAYIIHGWGHDSNMVWIKWLEGELKGKGFEVFAFDMPNTFAPKIEEWMKYLEEQIDSEKIDKESWFVGHSIGAQTIMRFLEKLHKHKKVAGCFFVAPWLNLINLEPDEMEIAHPWINLKIDFGRIVDHCNNFTAIFSDDDPYVHLDEADKFRENLGARIIIKKGMKHFEEAEEIPEILEVLR